MSVKALEKEYQAVVAQYLEMRENLKDLEAELAEGLISPEFFDNLKKQIAPIKQNYEWWSYVMFTLHEPNRKEKRSSYRKKISAQVQKLDPENSPERRLEAGSEALVNMMEVR